MKGCFNGIISHQHLQTINTDAEQLSFFSPCLCLTLFSRLLLPVWLLCFDMTSFQMKGTIKNVISYNSGSDMSVDVVATASTSKTATTTMLLLKLHTIKEENNVLEWRSDHWRGPFILILNSIFFYVYSPRVAFTSVQPLTSYSFWNYVF